MHKYLLLVASIVILPFACNKITVDKPGEVTLPEIIVPSTPGKTPKYKCYNCTLGESYVKALGYIEKHANTDEFEKYFLKKRTRLSHVDGKSPEMAIKTFREQLALEDEILISFYWNPVSKGLGAWDKGFIKQNTKYKLKPYELSGHLLHETSHKYGWKHLGNYKDKNDNLNSFPYAVGDEFKNYLVEKGL